MKITECLAEIAIQGDQVLSLVNCTQERAVYEVIGFDEPKIVIVDYRQKPIRALCELLETGNIRNFAPIFNSPSMITIQEDADDTVLIELSESNGLIPDKMFWIAIGIRDSIPVYDYHFEWIVPISEEAFAFIALFDIPSDFAQQISGTSVLHNRI